jgi:hypothetical protein
MWKFSFYLAVMLSLNILMATAAWGSAYLSLAIIITYFTFRPATVLHPNNMVFGYYGLYVILSSTLTLSLEIIDWDYVLPWGQHVFWKSFSKYLLFQAEFTFLVLFFALRSFTKESVNLAHRVEPVVKIRPVIFGSLYLFSFVMVAWFIQATGGLNAWLTSYSHTFLTGRGGHGLLNLILITLGNIVVYLLALKLYYAENKWLIALQALIVMFPLSFVTGVKSRFIFLLILLLSPYLIKLKLKFSTLALFAVSFFILLYVGTLVRTEGFYATAPFFLEMLIGYFNAFQLHDLIVTSRDPGLLQTVFFVFTKPLQFLGLSDASTDFDISVMLTKEFFPDSWEKENATQQWPLDTELYLNYYGFYFSWIPLIIYASWISWIYRAAVVQRNLFLMPIFIIEFARIFSTLRGTLLPWATPVYIAQYLAIYIVCRLAIKSGGRQSTVIKARFGNA